MERERDQALIILSSSTEEADLGNRKISGKCKCKRENCILRGMICGANN